MVVPSWRRELCNFSGDVWGPNMMSEGARDMLFTVGCSLNNHPILGGIHITHTRGWTGFIVDNWPAEASILTVPVKKPAGSATTCTGCRKTGSLWYLGTLCLTHSHSHSVVMHPVQPRPPGITHLIAVCGLLSLYLAAAFSISQKDTESWCPPWFHALTKFWWTHSSSFVYFSFLLGKTHQFQILPIISFSMFPTCSSYPHDLQFKSNINHSIFPIVSPLSPFISHEKSREKSV